MRQSVVMICVALWHCVSASFSVMTITGKTGIEWVKVGACKSCGLIRIQGSHGPPQAQHTHRAVVSQRSPVEMHASSFTAPVQSAALWKTASAAHAPLRSLCCRPRKRAVHGACRPIQVKQ